MRNSRKISYALVANILPHLYFLFYFILCIIHYNTRLVYSDNAYFLYSLVQEESFAIFHHRWVGIFTQWIPLLMIKCSLPLKAVAIGYSLNLALFYYLVFLLIAHIYKKPLFALVIVAISGLLQHYAFYWQVSELNSGLPLFILIVWILYNKILLTKLYKMLFFGTILSASVFFIHPLLNIILISTLIGLYIYSKNKNVLVLIGTSTLALLLKYAFLSGFEESKIQDFNPELFRWETIRASYLYYALKTFLKEQFFIAKIGVLLFGIYLLYKRKWLLLVYFSASIIALFLLIYYYIPNGEIVSYMETYFIMLFVPIFVVLFTILEYEFSPYKNHILVLVVAISAFALYKTQSDDLFKNRYNYVQRLTNEADDLSYIEKGELEESIIMLAWAFPYETLLLSSIEGHSKSIYYNEHQINFGSMQDSNVFVGASWSQYTALDQLNQTYFKIQPQFYQRMNGLNK